MDTVALKKLLAEVKGLPHGEEFSRLLLTMHRNQKSDEQAASAPSCKVKVVEKPDGARFKTICFTFEDDAQAQRAPSSLLLSMS